MHKHIILISIDTLRFDCVGYQPDKRELEKYDVLKYLETPTLDSIAEKSLCFTQCVSTSTYTTAAHASLFTGLYPPRHGVRAFYGTRLSKDVFTIMEILKIFGYETVCLTDSPVVIADFFQNRGFDHFFLRDDNKFIKFLQNNKDKKLFIFIHFMDVHSPYLFSYSENVDNSDYIELINSLFNKYNIVLPDKAMNMKKLWQKLDRKKGPKNHKTFLPFYVRGVSKFDKGRFNFIFNHLESDELLKDSIMFIFSDHGEGRISFDNREALFHAGDLCESVIRIPLMIFSNDITHAINSNPVSIIDIFPTILGSLAQNAEGLLPYSLNGVDLLKSCLDENRFLYLETMRADTRREEFPWFISYRLHQRGLRNKKTKYIVSGYPEILSQKETLNNMGNDEFLQALFRGLLCRFEKYWEYLHAIRELNNELMTRDEFIKRIIDSEEYKSIAHFRVFDLDADPFEEKPKIIYDICSDHKTFQFFNIIFEISKNPVKGEEIFPEDEDQIKRVIERVAAQATKPILQSKKEILLKNRHIFSLLISKFLESIDKKSSRQIKNNGVELLIESDEFARFIAKEYLLHNKNVQKMQAENENNIDRSLFSHFKKRISSFINIIKKVQ